ncbi:MAG: hypothetical protein JWO67_889 [Streptosporangiaceae bacterium]|nr:hypothetical protein [Streptosporangiaceae bacterium]
MSTNDRVSVVLMCRSGHKHELCVPISRGVPPELRCSPQQPDGYVGGGGGCQVPLDLTERVERKLRDAFQESKRRGYVLIEND